MTDQTHAITAEVMEKVTIKAPEDQRKLLLDAMVALVEGRMNVAQANALAALSCEVHKSIRQQFDILVYAAEHFKLGEGNQLVLTPGDPQG